MFTKGQRPNIILYDIVEDDILEEVSTFRSRTALYTYLRIREGHFDNSDLRIAEYLGKGRWKFSRLALTERQLTLF